MMGVMAFIFIPVTVALVFLCIYLFMKGAREEETKYTIWAIVVAFGTLLLWWGLIMFITKM